MHDLDVIQTCLLSQSIRQPPLYIHYDLHLRGSYLMLVDFHLKTSNAL